MAEADGFEHGTPGWIDLSSPDIDASVRFYGELFGWDATDAGDPEETGGYRMFTVRDKHVAGVGPQFQENMPAAWNTYFYVDDADAIAKAVAENGGTEIMGVMDVMDVGRMGVFQDPAGAFFSVWEPKRHRGAQLVNEPGTFTWSELATRDVDAASAFYTAVFSFAVRSSEFGEGQVYHEWLVGDRSVAGMTPMPDGVPDEIPGYWLTYFAVEDTDDAATRCESAGGSVQQAPFDTPAGRMAVLADPHGGVFAVIAVQAQDDADGDDAQGAKGDDSGVPELGSDDDPVSKVMEEKKAYREANSGDSQASQEGSQHTGDDTQGPEQRGGDPAPGGRAEDER